MIFTYICFGVPGQRGGRRHLSSLASKVNAAVACFPASYVPVPVHRQNKPFKSRQLPDVNLAARVSSKLEDGDIRRAIRLTASDDTMAQFDDVTAVAVRAKHPSRAASHSTQPTPSTESCLCLRHSDVLAAIMPFVPGSEDAMSAQPVTVNNK